MPYEFATYERRTSDHVAVITINRPEVMNALHPPAARELSAIWDEFAADPELWVAILTGAGDRAFSAGNDLKYVAEPDDPGLPATGWGGFLLRFDLWKPTIAAVNGWAVGGGMEMTVACDIAVASETARFSLPEVRLGGVATESGGAHRLPRHVPMKLAMGILLTGDAIDAREAYRAGIVNDVVPPEQLLPTAERWAARIVRSSPLAVRATKEASVLGAALPLDAAMLRRYPGVERLNVSEDRQESQRAAAEGREPRWQGR